jgi:hypothetical protein
MDSGEMTEEELESVWAGSYPEISFKAWLIQENNRLREDLEWLMSNGGDIMLHQGKYAYYNPQRKGDWAPTKLDALRIAKQNLDGKD